MSLIFIKIATLCLQCIFIELVTLKLQACCKRCKHKKHIFSLLFFLIGILLFFKKYLDIIFQFMYIAFIINIKSQKMKAKKYTCLDIALIKFAVIAFVLFAVAMCPWLQNWLLEVCPWYLLIAAILLSIKPVITFFGQKGS